MTLYDAVYHPNNGRDYLEAQSDSTVPYRMVVCGLMAEPIGSWAQVWCVNGERDEHILKRTKDDVVRE